MRIDIQWAERVSFKIFINDVKCQAALPQQCGDDSWALLVDCRNVMLNGGQESAGYVNTCKDLLSGGVLSVVESFDIRYRSGCTPTLAALLVELVGDF